MMNKHTIRDILPPEDRDKRRLMRRDQVSREPVSEFSGITKPAPEGLSSNIYMNDTGTRKKKTAFIYIIGASLVAIIVLVLLFSFVFAGATVTVLPKTADITASGNFTASSESESEGGLTYEIMTLETIQTKALPASGSENAEVKASGQIVIYNNYNASPQRLIRNTRFETPEGLIYRIDKSVVVPGKTTKNGESTPGSIEVTVYADEAGEKYNIGLTDFTIPGFKGQPQYEGFYARSTSPMTGGFVGKRLYVEEKTLEVERALLHEQLRAELMGKIAGELPEGYISFDESIFIDFVTETPEEKGEQLEIREKAVLYNVLFKDNALAGAVAVQSLPSFNASEKVLFRDASSLTLKPLSVDNNPTLPMMPWNAKTFSFELSGNASLVWQFDGMALKQDLSGRNKEAINTILSGYPSIKEAEVVIRPFWKGSFPTDIEDITIETVLPE